MNNGNCIWILYIFAFKFLKPNFMKSLFFTFLCVFFVFAVDAQSPQRIKFQTIVYDLNNNLVVNKKVGIRVSILQGSISGKSIYSEAQTPQTGNNGMLSVEYGKGKDFESINWSKGPYYLRAEIDPAGKNNYTMIIHQLIDVNSDNFTSKPYSTTVKDIDGNEYKALAFGNQTWMIENLRTTKLNDGRTIKQETDNFQWAGGTPAFCWYNNEVSNARPYGGLYNFQAVQTGKLCPTGWRVPSDRDWKELERFLGMSRAQADAPGWRGTDEATRMKNTKGWNHDGNGTNLSGFTAMPGGLRSHNGCFYRLENYAFFWTSTEANANDAHYRNLYYGSGQVYRFTYNKNNGFSVRCIKE
jgi:uncharacterized protein (TIGR02145 family)